MSAAISAATCSRSCRRSISARPRWATASGWRRRGGVQHQGRQARDRVHGRRRVLAQRPDLRRRQRGVQQVRQRAVIVDNGYTSATGGQDILSSSADNKIRATAQFDRKGRARRRRQWVRTLTHTYNVSQMRDTLREALTTTEKGPKVIVAQCECMLNKQRRIRPLMPRPRGRQARGARALRRRSGHLHGRSFLHPPVGLPVADGRAEPRSAAHRSGRAK